MSTESCSFRKQGILRAEAGKSRSASAVSVEFKQVEPTSPQPSIDRLSVSFANDDKKVDAGGVIKHSITENDEDVEDEDEYSASANVILERKNSWKRRSSKRRPSSPFNPNFDTARRRSSVRTSSSGETGASADDIAIQSMRLHKQVVAEIKYVPWPMRRKLRMVQQAKTYIKLHEGQIQERLAQSKSTRDILAHIRIVLLHFWNYARRELSNILNNMIPWESRIKEIESHFGSAVASYFTFHRWLFAVNVKISIALLVLVMLPEVFIANSDVEISGERKHMLPEEKMDSKKFLNLWNFEGILKHSVLFYGYYNSQSSHIDYALENKLPLIYFMTGIGVYIYSFVAILRKMAENSRQSKLTEKDEDFIFTWKLFTSWDFMIGNTETANNRVSSIILGFKEALLEEAEKTREEKRNWKLFSIRMFTHLNVLWLLGTSMYAVILVVGRSLEKRSGWWHQNEVTIVITLIGMIYPILFDMIGFAEKYHPRKALRLQLARIMVLNLLNLYTFIFATFSNIDKISFMSNCTKPEAKKIAIKMCKESRMKAVLVAVSLVGTKISPSPPQNLVSQSLHDPSEILVGNFDLHHNTFNKSFPIFDDYENKNIHNSFHNVILKTYNDKTTIQPTDRLNIFQGTEEYPTIYLPADQNAPTDYMTYMDNDLETSSTILTSSVSTDEVSITENSLSMSTDYQTTNVYKDEQTDGSSELHTYSSSDETEVTTSFQTTPISDSPSITAEYDFSTEPNDGKSSVTNLNEIDDKMKPYSSSTKFQINRINPNSDEYFTTSQNQINTESSTNVWRYINSTNVPPTTYGSVTVINQNYSTTMGFNTSENSSISNNTKVISSYCQDRVNHIDISSFATLLRNATRKKIHELCWETMFGQELVKLTVMDLVMTASSILLLDFFRALFVKYLNSCWCWDLEKTFPQYGDFKIAENILHLVNNQGMVWMGMFFSPGLPLINVLKLVILMYLRSWAVLTCNVPHEIVFRASRSNNFYFGLLLTMLFLCVLPVGYALVRIDPSWHCGPFSTHEKIYHIFTKFLKSILPKRIRTVLDYIASPGIIIPLLVLLILIIYYLLSLTSALREANDDLKIQLRRERTEERRKVFQMANRKKKRYSTSESPFSKWATALNANFSTKTSIDLSSGITSNDKNHSKVIKNPKFMESKGEYEKTSEKYKISENEKEQKDCGYQVVKERQERNSSNSDVFRDREDSVISGWSIDNIPEIKISQSNSLDNDSRNSLETMSHSKSSSKETIINVDPGKEENIELQDDVFQNNSVKFVKKASTSEIGSENLNVTVAEKQEDTENEESIGFGDSYESITKSIIETNDIGKEASPTLMDKSDENRKNFAKVFVESLKK